MTPSGSPEPPANRPAIASSRPERPPCRARQRQSPGNLAKTDVDAGVQLTASGTLKRVMKAFDWQLRKKGYIPMAGQIVDASLVPAPKQRNSDGEKAAIKAGKTAREI